MRENRTKTIATLALIVLVLGMCVSLIGASTVRASGQSGSSVVGKGLGDAKPIRIDGNADKDVHVTTGWKLFLVGTNQYDNMDEEDDLHYAVKDVQALRDAFIALGVPKENITILTTGARRGLIPNKRNIETAFQTFIASLEPGDCAFVYLSGHGFRFEREKRTYYAPQNVEVSSKSSIENTSVSIDDMITALNDSAANLKWMTVDACRNDPTKYMDDEPEPVIKGMKNIGVAKDCIVDSTGLPKTFIFMQGCEDGQCSIESPELEQGLMTYSLLEALRYDDNPVDRDKKFEIKLVDLLSYVQSRTEELAGRCRDRSNHPCVQKPAITNYALQNATFLTELRHDGLTQTEWQEIAVFENYLANNDIDRAEGALADIVGFFPEGESSEKYKELNKRLQEKKRQKVVDEELAQKKRDAEECFENAQIALKAEKYVKAKKYIDDAIELYNEPNYTKFRNNTLTRALGAEIDQLISDRDYEAAESLNKLLAEIDTDAAAKNEPKISALKKPAVTTPTTPKSDNPGSNSGQQQVAVASGSKAGDSKTLTIAGVKVNFRWAPAGTFQMGSPESEKERFSGNREKQHTVTLTKGFWIAETETTQELWEAVMWNNPSWFKGSNQLPVEEVSWNDCRDFVAKLNSSYSSELPSGYKYAMPTEAQWEYACRAGTTTPFNFGSTLYGDKANCDGNYPYGTSTKGAYKETTTTVRSYDPNAWGLYDMHGNVYEWCSDWFDSDYYKSSAASKDPAGPSSGSCRVLRGGSWDYSAKGCRSASRNRNEPDNRYNDYGFRLVLVR